MDQLGTNQFENNDQNKLQWIRKNDLDKGIHLLLFLIRNIVQESLGITPIIR